MSGVLEQIEAARLRASHHVPGRRDMRELYRLLTDCARICRVVDETNALQAVKSEALKKGLDGRNRSYFESDADAPLVVCRLVFEGEKRRDAAWRYTATLREAQKHQIDPEQLADWLHENGGINALFRRREKAARSRTTRTLHLNSPLTIPEDGKVSVTLCADGRGYFDVLAVPS